MIENITLIFFIIILISSIVLKLPLALALFFNLILLIIYCLISGKKLKDIFDFIYEGFKTCRLMLFIFILIGMITASWRSCGTISYIIYKAVNIISPKFFFAGIFLFNALVSMLTGTSFGTSSTAGVISMSLAIAMHMNPYIAGGAIISGCFIGDRTSPMSTAGLLVSTITKTDFYTNIKNMIKTAIIPIILTIITFQIFNLQEIKSLQEVNLSGIRADFHFNIILVLPAILIIIFSLFKLPLKYNMSISIFCAVLISYIYQKRSLLTIFKSLFLGYFNPLADKSINGGGVVSMIQAILIVGISSGYFGIFKNTDLLKNIKIFVNKVYDRTSPLLVMEVLSVLIACFSTNQTLSIMLTYEMSRDKFADREKLALNLSNSSVLSSMFIPWNISGRIPVETIGAPIGALYFSFFNIYAIIVNTIIDIFTYKKRAH